MTISGSSFVFGIVLWLFLFQFPNTALAQKYPLEISGTRFESSELMEHEGSVGIENRHSSLILPIIPLDSFKVFLFFKEDGKNLSYEEFPEEIALQKTSQTYTIEDFPKKLVLSTRGVIMAFVFEESTWVLRRDESIATDWEDISAEDRSFANQIMYRPKSSDSVSWMFGLSHMGGIAEDSYYPLLGYFYKGDVVHINLVLPAFGILQFRLGEYFYILLDSTVESNSYRLTEQDPWNHAYFSFLNLTSRIEAGIRFGDFEVGLSYGVNSFRFWDIYDMEHNELGSFEMKQTPTASLQIQWNI